MNNKLWLEDDLNNQTSLNKTKKNADPSSYVCWLYFENGQYFVTDGGVKLIATVNQRKMYKLRALLNTKGSAANSANSNGSKFIRIYLKQYLYSSMVNFGSDKKEPYVFMMIDDFEIQANDCQIKLDTNKLATGCHPSVSKQFDKILRPRTRCSIATPPTPSNNVNNKRNSNLAETQVKANKNNQNSCTSTQAVISPVKASASTSKEQESNLSQLLNDMTSMSQVSNYTIEIVETTSTTSKTKPTTPISTDPMLKHPPQSSASANNAKKNADLNEAFVKDTQTQPAPSTTASQLTNKDSLFIADNLISSTATASSSIKLSTQLNECAPLEFSSIHSSPTQNRVHTRCFVKITPLRKLPELAEANNNQSSDILLSDDQSSVEAKPPKANISEDLSSDEDNDPKKICDTQERSPMPSPIQTAADTQPKQIEITTGETPFKKLSEQLNESSLNSPRLDLEPKSALTNLINGSRLVSRRESTYSSSSDGSNCTTNLTAVSSLTSLIGSPSSIKRKRKLMEKDNKACDRFNRVHAKLSTPVKSKLCGLVEDLNEDTDDEGEEASVKSSLLNSHAKKGVLETSLNSSSRSSSSSSLSMSPSSPSLSSLTDFASKSLIFAPKQFYSYKEKLFKKSFSEHKKTGASNGSHKKMCNLFQPKSKQASKLTDSTASDSASLETPVKKPKPFEMEASLVNDANKSFNLTRLNSNVLDNLIYLDRESSAKKVPYSAEKLGHESELNESLSNKNRRRRLFNPTTQNVDQAFDSVDQTEDSKSKQSNTETSSISSNPTSSGEQTKSNLSSIGLNMNDKSIPSGQNPPKGVYELSTINKSSLSSNESVSSVNNEKSKMLNYNFQIDPDGLQTYLLESKKSLDCVGD